MSFFMGSYFVTGFLVGFSVAAPIGPVAIFCIRQTLAFGTLSGLTAGVAVSLADAIYSWFAAHSTLLIKHLIDTYSLWFYFFGGSFLVFLGITIFRSTPPQVDTTKGLSGNLFKSFYRTLLLTFASPMTTLLFIAMFNAYHVFETPLPPVGLYSLVIGVFFGALSWWILLAFFVSFIKKRSSARFFRYINYISGSLITGYGLFTLYEFLKLRFFT